MAAPDRRPVRRADFPGYSHAVAFSENHRTAIAARGRCAHKMSGFPRRTGRSLLSFSRARSARRNSGSFSRRVRTPYDVFVPARMIALGEMQRNVAANDRAEGAALREHA